MNENTGENTGKSKAVAISTDETMFQSIAKIYDVEQVLCSAMESLKQLAQAYTGEEFYRGDAKEEIANYYNVMLQHVSRITELYNAGMLYGIDAVSRMIKLDTLLSGLYNL